MFVFSSTFMAFALGLLAIWSRQMARRRAHGILLARDPAGQQATVVRDLSLAERCEVAAKQAGLNWSARSLVAGAGGGVLFGMLVALGGQVLIGAVLAGASPLIPWLIVRQRQRVRADQFTQQLPGALMLAANTIRSGGTLLQGIQAVARQMDEPLRSEFVRIEKALRLQTPIGTALQEASQRIGAREFKAVVVACKIAGKAGGDLDNVLENISREIVEDRQFREALQAASSEGRASARIVTMIPIVMAGFFMWNEPTYFDPMLITANGKVLLMGSAGAIVLGWLIIKRITDIRTW